MGHDLQAVVNDRLKPHGIENLRVIDASVMPAITSDNTNSPTIMSAEKSTAMVAEDGRREEQPERGGVHARGTRLPHTSCPDLFRA